MVGLIMDIYALYTLGVPLTIIGGIILTIYVNQQLHKSNRPAQKLIDAVIEEIKNDLNNGDETALDALLYNVDRHLLVQYLPEEEWHKYKR